MASVNGREKEEPSSVITLPAQSFGMLLAGIDDLAELKVTLFCLAALQQKEGQYRFLRFGELRNNADLMRGLASTEAKSTSAEGALQSALRRAIERCSLLATDVETGGVRDTLYFANDSRGRALQGQIQAGEWAPDAGDEIVILPPRPTIYALYEDNFGPLTPMISDALKEAEASYPRHWIEEAMRYAAERNARNWRYVSKVLETWQQEGRSRETNERDSGRRAKYTSGKWKDYIKS